MEIYQGGLDKEACELFHGALVGLVLVDADLILDIKPVRFVDGSLHFGRIYTDQADFQPVPHVVAVGR